MKEQAAFDAAMERYRVSIDGHDNGRGTRDGMFVIQMKRGGKVYNLHVVTSDGARWRADGLTGPAFEHVSISVEDRSRWPLHAEVKIVRDMIFGPSEVVIQYHPAVGSRPSAALVVHLWRPVDISIIPSPDPRAIN